MSCKFEKDGKYEEIDFIQPLKNIITWDIIRPSDDMTAKRQEKALKRAFLRLAQYIKVSFKYTENKGNISITVSDEDNYFKDRPNALAYAYVGTTSQEVDLVFNESYNWVLNEEIGNNNFDMEIVALHEICHVLGLRHSTNPKSIMYPSYQGIRDLDKEDIEKLQQIHEARTGWSLRIYKLKGYFQRVL